MPSITIGVASNLLTTPVSKRPLRGELIDVGGGDLRERD